MLGCGFGRSYQGGGQNQLGDDITPEQIIKCIQRGEQVRLDRTAKRSRSFSSSLGISEQTYYRWRQNSVRMKVDQARRFEALANPLARLKRVGCEPDG